MSKSPYDRLTALGIQLPPAPKPLATYVPYVIDGDKLYLSGQGPLDKNGTLYTGKVGDTITTQQAAEHARITAINLIAVMHEALGDLSRVRRIVKVLGMVNAVPDYGEHPRVINGCSDLLVDVFGDAGRHARSAIGFGSLPDNITVEIEAIIAFD